MARVLIVGGGCAGRRLARELLREDGHAVRILTRAPSRRPEIEGAGAECAIGDPNRLATLAGVLDGVTVACWLLAGARGEGAEALHRERLQAFLGLAIDSTVRGFVYEPGAGGPGAAGGEGLVETWAARNAVPVAFVRDDRAGDPGAWVAQARGAIAGLLG